MEQLVTVSMVAFSVAMTLFLYVATRYLSSTNRYNVLTEADRVDQYMLLAAAVISVMVITGLAALIIQVQKQNDNIKDVTHLVTNTTTTVTHTIYNNTVTVEGSTTQITGTNATLHDLVTQDDAPLAPYVQSAVTQSNAYTDAQVASVSVATMIGATNVSAGTNGSVPTPAAGDESKFLRGDATWGHAVTYTGKSIITPTSNTVSSSHSLWEFRDLRSVTLEDGSYPGQILYMFVFDDNSGSPTEASAVVNITSYITGLRSITFDAKFEGATLLWTGTVWHLIDTSGTIGVDQVATHVFILAGQSNMVGQGTYDALLDTTDARILQWDRDTSSVILASEPLKHVDPIAGRMGLAMTFAKAYLNVIPSEDSILLIPVADGGTSFVSNEWNQGDPVYNDAVSKTNAALASLAGQAYTIDGVLWHQGESDVIDGGVGAYESALTTFMSAFRADTGTTTAPFIVGGMLPDFITVHGVPGFQADAIIQSRPMEVPRCRFTYATGSTDTDLSDNGHFDAVSLRIFGMRYFHSLRLSQATTIKYPLNDNSSTLVDLGPSGLITTGATPATWSLDAGTKGRYVVYPTTTPITLGATTLAAVEALTEGSVSIWFSIDDPSLATVLWAYSDINTVNADMSMWVIDDGASFTFNFQKRRTSGTTQRYGYTLSDTTWHHAVMAVNSGGTKLYLDGVDVTATAVTTLGDMTTDTDFFSQYKGAGFDGLYLGGWKSSNGNEFVGTSETLLSNFQVFNKALSADEITVLYNADL